MMNNPKAMAYKIVFSDIDGTLLDSKSCISSNTVETVKKLNHDGIPFILVSARMPSGVAVVQKQLGIEAPVVCYSGALVLDASGNCVQSIEMDRETAASLYLFIQKEWKQVCCSAFYYNNWIVEEADNPWIIQEQKITSSVPEQKKITDFMEAGGAVHKFLCIGEKEQIAELTNTLKERYPGLSVQQSKPTYLEIMDGAASKAGALNYLCREYNIPVEASVAFGDGFNDTDMLLAAGTGVAMGNAPEEVKKGADYVTLDNDHEGLYRTLKQLKFAD